jgi:hypothetical protein
MYHFCGTFIKINRMEFYNIPTESLTRQYAPQGLGLLTTSEREEVINQAASDLVGMARSNQIWFPFQKYFRGTPSQLFANLQQLDLPIIEKSYHLRSYYPTYGTYLPARFRETPIIIEGSRLTYVQADVISDHFIEDVRLKAKRYDQKLSVLGCWDNDECLKNIMKAALEKERITPESLRETIYNTIPETKIFNPTWARALLKLVMGPDLAGKKWLDISAGWGDRLIAAMSLDMDYVGFDPNVELQPGHSQMIATFGNPNRHRVIYEPFEKGTIPPGPYDVVLSSPPYFTIEEYAQGQEGQSIVSYPDYTRWMVWFLFSSLSKAWENLKDGGYLILHLGDAKTIITSEAANIFIENYLPGASWEGVIGLQGEAGFPRPVWVWRKMPRGSKLNHWEPQHGFQIRTRQDPTLPEQKPPLPYAQRTLFNTFPELQLELVRFYASKYAPDYEIKRNSSNAIRDHIAYSLPNIPREEIDRILTDDLLLYSVLEVLQPEGTIQFFVNLVEQYPNIDFTSATQISEYYPIRKSSAAAVRSHVAAAFPMINPDVINMLLVDDLMITTLLETLDVEKTITWSVAMTKLAFRV